MGDQKRLLAHGPDEPCALQLGGSDPTQLAQAAQLGEQAGYQEVNLNVGCPSDRVQQGAIGACLMGQPDLVANCVQAMQQAVTIPVTVKCRIGIDDMDSYEHFSHFVRTVAAGGSEVFYVHARAAWLQGLSPKENREIPPLKYDYVTQIQQDFPDLTFILNGGIDNLEDALSHLQVFPGIMIGRAFYKDPMLLANLETSIYGGAVVDPLEVIDQYIEYARGTSSHPRHTLKHLLSLFNGAPGARLYRRHLSENMNRSDAQLELVYDALTRLQYVEPQHAKRHQEIL